MTCDLVHLSERSLRERLAGNGLSNAKVSNPAYPPFSEFFAEDGNWYSCIKLRGQLDLVGTWDVVDGQIRIQTRLPKFFDGYFRNADVELVRDVLMSKFGDTVLVNPVLGMDDPAQKVECKIELGLHSDSKAD